MIGIQPRLAVVTDVGVGREDIFCIPRPEVVGKQPRLATIANGGDRREEIFCVPRPEVVGKQPPLAVVTDGGGGRMGVVEGVVLRMIGLGGGIMVCGAGGVVVIDVGSAAWVEARERPDRVETLVMLFGVGELLDVLLVRLVREAATECVAARVRKRADCLVISGKWGMESYTIRRRQLGPKEIE